MLASTGKDWEGVGIPPTTKIEPDKALDLAQVHALRRLAGTASPGEKRALDGQAALLEAKVKPIPTALPLERYAGTYGERSVTMEGGGLVYQRQGGPKVSIIAVAANEFSFNEDPGARIRFNVSGNNVTGLELVRGDGTKVEAQRTQ